TRFVTRYLEGEYQVQLVDANWTGLPSANVPGAYTDASLAVDARIAGTIPGRIVAIGCRDPDGTGGYALWVEPGNTRAALVRYEAAGSVSLPQMISAWRSVPNFRTGTQPNRLELSCAGNTISATVNGTDI